MYAYSRRNDSSGRGDARQRRDGSHAAVRDGGYAAQRRGYPSRLHAGVPRRASPGRGDTLVRTQYERHNGAVDQRQATTANETFPLPPPPPPRIGRAPPHYTERSSAPQYHTQARPAELGDGIGEQRKRARYYEPGHRMADAVESAAPSPRRSQAGDGLRSDSQPAPQRQASAHVHSAASGTRRLASGRFQPPPPPPPPPPPRPPLSERSSVATGAITSTERAVAAHPPPPPASQAERGGSGGGSDVRGRTAVPRIGAASAVHAAYEPVGDDAPTRRIYHCAATSVAQMAAVNGDFQIELVLEAMRMVETGVCASGDAATRWCASTEAARALANGRAALDDCVYARRAAPLPRYELVTNADQCKGAWRSKIDAADVCIFDVTPWTGDLRPVVVSNMRQLVREAEESFKQSVVRDFAQLDAAAPAAATASVVAGATKPLSHTSACGSAASKDAGGSIENSSKDVGGVGRIGGSDEGAAAADDNDDLETRADYDSDSGTSVAASNAGGGGDEAATVSGVADGSGSCDGDDGEDDDDGDDESVWAHLEGPAVYTDIDSFDYEYHAPERPVAGRAPADTVPNGSGGVAHTAAAVAPKAAAAASATVSKPPGPFKNYGEFSILRSGDAGGERTARARHYEPVATKQDGSAHAVDARVALELGYAVATKRAEQIVLVVNASYGSAAALPAASIGSLGLCTLVYAAPLRSDFLRFVMKLDKVDEHAALRKQRAFLASARPALAADLSYALKRALYAQAVRAKFAEVRAVLGAEWRDVCERDTFTTLLTAATNRRLREIDRYFARAFGAPLFSSYNKCAVGGGGGGGGAAIDDELAQWAAFTLVGDRDGAAGALQNSAWLRDFVADCVRVQFAIDHRWDGYTRDAAAIAATSD